MPRWNHRESESLYNVPNWADGFFHIGPGGNVHVTPDGPGGPSTDLFELTGQILRRGVAAPILMRFDGILRARVRRLHEAFDRARAEYGYEPAYRGVLPIKVNQERLVVEAVLEGGREYGMGLEVGSKPELIAGIALQAHEGSLLICNGYKDEEYVEMAMRATQLGVRVIIVIEKFTELATVLAASRRLGIQPILGVRSKLSFRGSGRWQESAGDRSKFGLTTREIVRVVETLAEQDMLGCLELLHFHIGSQITHIRSLKQAMREATNIFVGLARMGATIRWFDAGGGLGVDYDGSSSNFDSSMNYSLQEYANDIVWSLSVACREAEVPEPVILTESGRALVAHHALLVGEVVGVTGYEQPVSAPVVLEEDPDVVRHLVDIWGGIGTKNLQEAYHDVNDLREEAMILFNAGQLELRDRARAEELYWRACRKILAITRDLDYVPDDMQGLERELADTYFVNFSLFQSMPDSWAIHQLFPIMPLHRHDEEPTRRAVLADLTCDSDGKIDRFIDLRDVKRTLELHPLREGEPYYLGFFLVGAYQEILGDMHNLFGDTNVVHIDFDGEGRPRLRHVQRGDRVKEVLDYVEFEEQDLIRRVRRQVEEALDAGRMSYEESALFLQRYEESLRGYTYLTRNHSNAPAAGDRELARENPTSLPR